MSILMEVRDDKAASRLKARVIAALLILYIAWSSTYLAIRFSLESFPPFFTAGSRYMLVGLIMFLYMRWRGAPPPTKAQWKGSAIIGTFLLLGGTGGVVYAMQWVGSGTAALVVATTPLWTVLFAGIWGQWPLRREWTGLVLGCAGIILLNVHGDLRAQPGGAVLLLISAASWSFGSVLSQRLALPSSMMASALQMFSGGLLVLIIGFVTGERIPAHPSVRSVAALVYLAVFGSLLGYTAYTYLLKHVRPSLATSYSYVNPGLAVLLGVWFAGEQISMTGIAAMLTILAGVVLVVLGQRK